MPASTLRLALPYPVPDDTVDVPRDIQALAAKLDPNTALDSQGTFAARPTAGVQGRYYYATDKAILFRDNGTAWVTASAPAFATSLPSSPIDGQEIYYQASAADGVIWHLRYRAGSASAYKWEYVGGPALHSYTQAQGSTLTTNWSHLQQYGPEIAIPLAGDYEVMFGANSLQTTVPNGGGDMGVSFSTYAANTPSQYETVSAFDATSAVVAAATGTFRVTGLTAGSTATCVYRSQSNQVAFYWSGRFLWLRPIRVG